MPSILVILSLYNSTLHRRKVLASLNAADQWILQHQDRFVYLHPNTGLAPHIATPYFTTLKPLQFTPEQSGHSITTTHQQLSARPLIRSLSKFKVWFGKTHHTP